MSKPKPVITNARMADENHRVVTVEGGRGEYRRRPCGGPESTAERPGCPWRVDGTGQFPAEAFAISAYTAENLAMRTFGCHESGTENPSICAGFLLRGADHNMAVRMMLSQGKIDYDQITDGGHELHPGYITMAIENGLSEDSPSLRECRWSYEEEQR